jgi:hypothetical protein
MNDLRVLSIGYVGAKWNKIRVARTRYDCVRCISPSGSLVTLRHAEFRERYVFVIRASLPARAPWPSAGKVHRSAIGESYLTWSAVDT